jgi:uncharacterized protein (TIGR03437 family)
VARIAMIFPILAAAACCRPAIAQALPATLKVEVENAVEYQFDTADTSKFGTNPNITTGGLSCTDPILGGHLGHTIIALGDIVAVNGQSAKGTYLSQAMGVCLTPTPVPGEPVADTTWNTYRHETFQILQSDGTAVGTIMTSGFNAGSPAPPGLPSGTQNYAIVGGTGAFLGAAGQTGNAMGGLGAASIPIRLASIAEDPANRRKNGGGHVVFTLYVIPTFRPEVAVTANGPAVAHSSDFSPVNSAKPAAAGEILSLFATGLGPTGVALNPGQAFPSSPLAQVTSPVDVTVNGEDAQVMAAVGYPGSVGGYQVNFRLPADTEKGPAMIQVSAAWIAGAVVSIPVQ